MKKSLAAAPIHQRHALIERLRELLPPVAVRKLCALLNLNRQWSDQQRGCSVQNDRDRPLCLARHPLRKDEAF